MRPFEEQSPLERVIRSHLWGPDEFLKNYDSRLKEALKKKDYQLAWQLEQRHCTSKADSDTWKHILDLYEFEFGSTRPRPVDDPRLQIPEIQIHP